MEDEKPPKVSVTNLLHSLPQKQDDLYERVYDHLKAIARNRLNRENADSPLQTTELVNEAYMKLASQRTAWRDRRHFYGVASQAMRRILIDAARRRKSEKRGGGLVQHPLSGLTLPNSVRDAELLDLDEALNQLEKESPELAELVRLKFFSGLTLSECSEVLSVSTSTIDRRWKFARAWLQAKINNMKES